MFFVLIRKYVLNLAGNSRDRIDYTGKVMERSTRITNIELSDTTGADDTEYFSELASEDLLSNVMVLIPGGPYKMPDGNSGYEEPS